MKSEKSSICRSMSFIVVHVLVLIMLLEIYGNEGVAGLTFCAGINGSLMIPNPAESAADAIASESLPLLLLITTTQRIFLSKMCERK